MKLKLTISIVLIICILLCSCERVRTENTQGEDLVIKISYNSPNVLYGSLNGQSCFSKDPVLAVDPSFEQGLELKKRVFEDGKFVYTYDWGEIQPTDKVYMQPAIVVVPKIDSVRCYELREGLVTEVDDDKWFTVESVSSTTKNLGFDGYTSIGITITRHSGIFPHLLWIAANGSGYTCQGIVQTDPEYGQYTKGHYTFQLNAFDAMFGNLVLITSPQKSFYNSEDLFTLASNYEMDIDSIVEVEVVA